MLNKLGLGFVVVGDIIYDGDVEIINFEYVICYLMDDNVEIVMCIKVECGCGYVLVLVCIYIEEDECLIGCLFVDVIYSLVDKIVYFVDVVCVEQCIDLDKFVIDMEMNGILEFEEVICCVVIIFVE